MNTTTLPVKSSQRYSAIKNFKTSSPFLDELSEDDRVTVARARKLERFLSQPFFVAEVFTGSPGKYVKLEETIKGFQMILSGQLDDHGASFLHGRQHDEIAKAGAQKLKARRLCSFLILLPSLLSKL